MKRFRFLILWGMLPWLLAQCRPASSPRTAEKPKPEDVPQPSEKRPALEPETKNTEPAEVPADAGIPALPPPPVFRVTSRGEIPLRKLGSLSQNVAFVKVHPKCTGGLAAAAQWELARFDSSGKLAWSTRKNGIACPHGNRCHETPRAAVLPNENVVAVLDGDSLRMFNARGRMMALRGGFLQATLDFGVSPDGKLVAALYPHGLALWRATGGLVRKQELPGATRFSFDYTQGRHVQVLIGREVRRYELDFSGEPVTRTLADDGVDLLRNRVLTVRESLGPADAVRLPADLQPLRLVSTGMHVVLGMRAGRMVIQKLAAGENQTTDVQEWEITGISWKTPILADVNEGCLAAADGADVYFALLPPFGG